MQSLIQLLLFPVALLLSGCHVIFPFDLTEAEDTGPGVLEMGTDARDAGAELGNDSAVDSSAAEGVLDLSSPDLVQPPADGGPGSLVWSQMLGGTLADETSSVAVDPSGNVYIVGSFKDKVPFSSNTLVSSGDYDVFLVSFDPSGAPRSWHKTFGGTDVDKGQRVVTDKSGNVIITGSYTGKVSFGGNPLPTSSSGVNAFVASYDSNGNHRWSKGFVEAQGKDVTVDGARNVYVTGDFSGTSDFGDGVVTSSLASIDIFVASYDPTGTHRWSAVFGADGIDGGLGVAVDGKLNTYVVGQFQLTVDFGGGALSSNGILDAFVLGLDTVGKYRWAKQIGGTGIDFGLEAAVDGQGNVYAVGSFKGTVTIDGTTLKSNGDSDTFVSSYTSSGAHRWSAGIGGPGSDRALDVTVDHLGNTKAAGQCEAGFTVGGKTICNAGSSDILVFALDPAGAHLWSTSYGGPGIDLGLGIAASGPDLFVAGIFRQTVDFGGGPVTSKGGDDAFLIKLAP